MRLGPLFLTGQEKTKDTPVDCATAEAVQARCSEGARHLRDLAQQCYLLIGLTDDAWLKSHLLDLGVGLERRIKQIEG